MRNNLMNGVTRNSGWFVFCFLFVCMAAGANSYAAKGAKARKKPATAPLAQAAPTQVTLITSDWSIFRGMLIDRDDSLPTPLVTLKTGEGEHLHFSVNDLHSINGQPAKNYLKNFVPPILDEYLKSYMVSPNPKVRCFFSFYSDWEKTPQLYGFKFAAPAGDPKWEGFTLYFSCESPPKISGELSYKSVLKRLTDANFGILKQSYEIIFATDALLTQEVDKSGTARRSFWQFRSEKGELCMVQVSLACPDKAKLEQPLSKALFNKVIRSVSFSDDNIEIPEGVVYKKTSRKTNDAAKKILEQLFAGKGVGAELFADALGCGPHLWEQMKEDPAFKNMQVIKTSSVGDESKPKAGDSSGGVFKGKTAVKSFVKSLSERLKDNKNVNIRKLSYAELQAYWELLSLSSIEEPVYVVETDRSKYLVQFLKSLKICLVDDFSNVGEKK